MYKQGKEFTMQEVKWDNVMLVVASVTAISAGTSAFTVVMLRMIGAV